MKKRRVLLSALACLLLLPLVICGCSSENSGPVEIDSINASVRVVRIGSGLEILVVTRDNQGFPVETDGSLDIKLWLQEEKGGDVIYDLSRR